MQELNKSDFNRQELGRLVMSIADGTRAAHAFVIEGAAGEARRDFVNALAQGLECTSPDEGARPCGICPACRQVAAGTSLDVVHMQKSKSSGKTARESYKVDDASEFIERLNMGAYGRYLIGIIDDADSLSEVIQNKLLKTLEEPGPQTLILLAASNRDNLLSTVRSRCSDIRLSDMGMPEEELAPGEESDYSDLIRMLEDRRCRFHEFRATLDKKIKSKEESLAFLDQFEDDLRQQMASMAGHPADRAALQNVAQGIELAAVTRMDIRREMAYGKALRRLFLELR